MPRANVGPDFMIGPGGVGKTPKSEAAELTRALDLCEELRNRLQDDNMMQAQSVLSRIEIILNRLRSQSAGGYHRNPGGFEIVGVMSTDVHSVAYRHAKDGKNYKHDFDRGTAHLIAVTRNGKKDLILTSMQGVPLWDEF
jgi:hypothetical protein